MNTAQLKEQANSLAAYINNKVVKNQSWGLCNNVLLGNFPACDVFPSWELYSGDCTYPVGNGEYDYTWANGMHNRSTKYGIQRLSLAKHCLEWTLTQLRETV